MSRPAKPITPPWVDLKRSLEIAREMYDKGAGTVSYDDMARLLKNTVKSSAFRMKIVALKSFGLVSYDGSNVRLTALALAIIAPSSEQERQEATFNAFSSVGLHQSLYQKYKGGYLPEDAFLANTIVRDFGAAPESKDEWVECFKLSGRVAGVLSDEGGKVRVLQNAKASNVFISHASTPPSAPSPPESLPLHYNSLSNQTSTFPILLDEERSVMVPVDFGREDLEYLQGVLELYVKRRETRKA